MSPVAGGPTAGGPARKAPAAPPGLAQARAAGPAGAGLGADGFPDQGLNTPRGSPIGMLVINCKNYGEVAGAGITRLVGAAAAASERYGVRIAVAPPQHLAGLAAGGPAEILAQHADCAGPGSTTGHVVPELLKKSGIAGSLINHSERRIPPGEIRCLVERLSGLGMTSIVCARDVGEARRYARHGPDYVAIEPPDLIGSGRSVSTERPEIITAAADAVRSAGNGTGLLCGAGISSGRDVARAMELGSDGVLVASGIVKARGWRRAIAGLAKSMV